MSRQAELEALDWQAIKDIAEEYGIKKPPTGWKDAIPEILEFEEVMGDELTQSQPELPLEIKEEIPEKPVTQPKPKQESKPEIKPVFATDYYEATGIPFCPECGAPKTTVDGVQICPISNKDCKFIGS